MVQQGVREDTGKGWQPLRFQDEKRFPPLQKLIILSTAISLQTWLRYIPEECDWILETAGRNWVPTAVEGMLPGRGHVRAGTEDVLYVYPHKDGLIRSSVETGTKERRIAEELGREIATPHEARAILGLTGVGGNEKGTKSGMDGSLIRRDKA